MFKLGDKIKVTKLRGYGHSRDTIKIGDTGTVIENDLNRPWVEFDKNINGYNSYNGSKREKTMCMWNDEIELIKQFTKSDLKNGDIVTYRYGDRRTLIQGTFECNDFGKSTSVLEHYNEDLTMKNGNKGMDIIKVERPVKYETVFERKEEILDEAEKRYLRDVIRPFRNTVRFITKEDGDKFARIRIRFDCITMFFPPFEKEKKMYEGMQPNRAYTLEELRIIGE